MMISKISSIYKTDRPTSILFYITCFIIFYFIVFSFRIPLDRGDDSYYVNHFISLDWLVDRYHNWSSRLILDCLMVYFCHHHLIFRFINALAFTTLPLLIRSLLISAFKKETVDNKLPLLFIFPLIFLFPVHTMANSGWIATIVNYYIPFYLMILAAVMFNSIDKINKTGLLALVVGTIASIIATNQELVAILCIMLFCGCILFNIKRKYACLVLIIAGLSLLNTLTCPGNTLRYADSLYYIENYEQWNSPYKLYMGYIATFRRYFFSGDAICVFALMILVQSLKQSFRLALIAGLLMLAFQGIARSLVGGYKHQQILYYLGENFTLTLSGVIGTVIALALVAMFIYLWLKLDIAPRLKLLLGLMVACAITDRASLGFSPTLFASDARTFILSDFALLLASASAGLLSKRISKDNFIKILLCCVVLQLLLQSGKIVKHLAGT